MINPVLLDKVAKAICKSRSCEGHNCCQWPANTIRRRKWRGGLRHGDRCPVMDGGYDDAAKAAILAVGEET